MLHPEDFKELIETVAFIIFAGITFVIVYVAGGPI